MAAPNDDTPAARQRWQQQRCELYAARGRPISAAATRLAQDAKEEQDVPDEPWRRGRAGTNIGRAVHAVLQVVDLRTGSDLDDNVQAQAAAEGVPAQADAIARLVRRALDSSIVQRALDSKRWWRETPVAGPVGDGIVEGFIDLLFEEDDGYVIVDYKTDNLGSEGRDRTGDGWVSSARWGLRARFEQGGRRPREGGILSFPPTESRDNH